MFYFSAQSGTNGHRRSAQCHNLRSFVQMRELKAFCPVCINIHHVFDAVACRNASAYYSEQGPYYSRSRDDDCSCGSLAISSQCFLLIGWDLPEELLDRIRTEPDSLPEESYRKRRRKYEVVRMRDAFIRRMERRKRLRDEEQEERQSIGSALTTHTPDQVDETRSSSRSTEPALGTRGALGRAFSSRSFGLIAWDRLVELSLALACVRRVLDKLSWASTCSLVETFSLLMLPYAPLTSHIRLPLTRWTISQYLERFAPSSLLTFSQRYLCGAPMCPATFCDVPRSPRTCPGRTSPHTVCGRTIEGGSNLVRFQFASIRTWIERVLKYFGKRLITRCDAIRSRLSLRGPDRFYSDVFDSDYYQVPEDTNDIILSLALYTDGVETEGAPRGDRDSERMPFRAYSRRHTSGCADMNSAAVTVVYCTVLELSPSLRVRGTGHATTLLGVLEGPGPHHTLNPALEFFVAELAELERNPIVFDSKRTVRVRLHLLLGDMPALRKCAAFISHNANVFCTKCLANRRDVPDEALWIPVEGHARRTHGSVDREMTEMTRLTYQELERHSRIVGHRITVLRKAPSFDLVRGTCSDPMHNVYLGVCASVFKHLVTTYTTLEAHMRSRLRDVEELLPSDIDRVSSCSSGSSTWFRNLFMYYTPVLSELLEHDRELQALIAVKLRRIVCLASAASLSTRDVADLRSLVTRYVALSLMRTCATAHLSKSYSNTDSSRSTRPRRRRTFAS